MDNQFENDFYGFEPQRPFNEKTDDTPAPVPAAEGFQPQQPLMDAPAEPSAAEQSYNPIQHTAVYAGSRFVNQAAQQEPDGGSPAFPQQSAAPDGYYPRQQGAAPSGYYPPQQHAAPNGYYPPQQSAAPNGYYPPQQNAAPNGYYPQQQPYYQNAPQKENAKVNSALVVVIIVMGALLFAGLCGIVGFALFQASGNEGSPVENRNEEMIPEFTYPNGGYFEVPATTAPPKEHTESDYSDKAVKDFAGLKLAAKPSDYDSNTGYNAEYAFKQASGSVVSVLCFTDGTEDNTKAASQGSGIVISADGFIVTNSHVVNNSKTAYAIKVITNDGKEYKAGVVGFDARTDLAVLKLDGAKGLQPAVFGDSDKIELGDDLIIIGNPGGIVYQNSMTKGIVSAINRDASSKNIVKYIQTDAAINPGNSGGPAVNNCGQVIGVASAKIADEKYEGMGFCIPSVQVKKIADSLIRNGYVEGRVKIGITGNALTLSQLEEYQVPRGIMVYSIVEGGPCDNTDVRENDIITKLNDTAITSFSDIYQTLEAFKPGDKVKLTVYRMTDGKEHEVEITLQADK